MSENVTLEQFMESVGNVNYSVIIAIYWIFESNKKITSVDTRFIELHMLSFGRRGKVFRVQNNVPCSQINQQHRETQDLLLVNNIIIGRIKGFKMNDIMR